MYDMLKVTRFYFPLVVLASFPLLQHETDIRLADYADRIIITSDQLSSDHEELAAYHEWPPRTAMKHQHEQRVL